MGPNLASSKSLIAKVVASQSYCVGEGMLVAQLLLLEFDTLVTWDEQSHGSHLEAKFLDLDSLTRARCEQSEMALHGIIKAWDNGKRLTFNIERDERYWQDPRMSSSNHVWQSGQNDNWCTMTQWSVGESDKADPQSRWKDMDTSQIFTKLTNLIK